MASSWISQLVKNPPAMLETRFNSWVGEDLLDKDRLPTPVVLGSPCGSAGKESACNVGDLGSTPGLGRSPGDGKGYLLQYSGLENSFSFLEPTWLNFSPVNFHQFIVQFNHSVVSNSLQPHGLQHVRPPCPSPTPGAHPNSCPSSQ